MTTLTRTPELHPAAGLPTRVSVVATILLPDYTNRDISEEYA